ncbi:MAG: hypothetical protein QOF69_1007, partial [Solirubrobacteraceae bacterium]|nr:hypothetical protein [Solirubrobacteraceae bacterium]
IERMRRVRDTVTNGIDLLTPAA